MNNKMCNRLALLFVTVFSLVFIVECDFQSVDTEKTLIYGPGLHADEVVLPSRYFFIHAINKYGEKFHSSPPLQFKVDISGHSPHGTCRTQLDVIDRGDGSSIVRFNIIGDWCDQLELKILYNGSHVAQSPYYIRNKVHSEQCYCPQDLDLWLLNNKCGSAYSDKRISWDLHSFKKINFTAIRENLIRRYTSTPGTVSLCHYIVKQREIWRRCYGKYIGFKMFMDNTLVALNRVAALPDMEFFLNLGDWPLAKKGGQQRTSGPYPIFSWCGSDDSVDIVLPTYDITETTMQGMGKVAVDMLSVQRQEYPWKTKIEKGFWRGRDSRRDRLDLVDLSRRNVDLLNASLTNFFFFRNEESIYGPKAAHISFMEFFKYKYQIAIDGTVATYRFPYLLGGDALVFKQDSPFYEHFYSKLQPYKHYIPFKRDLSDLIEKLNWAKENDDKALEIVQAAREFVDKNLLPQNIYCYHLLLFKEWSNRIVSTITVMPGMEKVDQKMTCQCKDKTKPRDEL